jgi:hypothetical protein
LRFPERLCRVTAGVLLRSVAMKGQRRSFRALLPRNILIEISKLFSLFLLASCVTHVLLVPKSSSSGCLMTFMWPTYVPTNFTHEKYTLERYVEGSASQLGVIILLCSAFYSDTFRMRTDRWRTHVTTISTQRRKTPFFQAFAAAS